MRDGRTTVHLFERLENLLGEARSNPQVLEEVDDLAASRNVLIARPVTGPAMLPHVVVRAGNLVHRHDHTGA